MTLFPALMTDHHALGQHPTASAHLHLGDALYAESYKTSVVNEMPLKLRPKLHSKQSDS